MVKNGSLRLLKLAGVDIYLHWSWLIILYLRYSGSGHGYTNKAWLAAEVAVFIFMVLLHEAVQLTTGTLVGGSVTEMYVSFLGRSSNLQLPQRPWPIIITYAAGIAAYAMMLGATAPLYFYASRHVVFGNDVANLLNYAFFVNVILTVWTAMPVYPLDGGKILQAFLWLFMSRKRSLQIACVIGLIGSLAFLGLALWLNSYWSAFVAILMLFSCIQGFRAAKAFAFLEAIPRRTDVACPHCRQHPFVHTYITCTCGEQLDPFTTRGLCPACNSVIALVACPLCTQRSPIPAWFGPTGLFELQPTPSPAPASAPAVPSPPAPPPIS